MHSETERLFEVDKALRCEADQMLAESGIGEIIDDAGYTPVGSYAMHTMTWRDLDFERAEDVPDWEGHWEIGTRLAMTGWCLRLSCTNFQRYWPSGGFQSLYWGLLVADPTRLEPLEPGDKTIWKLDLHTMPPAKTKHNACRQERWISLMTEATRAAILAIKEAVCHEPEYRDTMLSIHIYEAVLECGVRDINEFRGWWDARFEEGEKG